MHIREELHLGKALEPGQELALSLLLTREYLSRLMDEKLFRPAGLTDQQFNVLRIVKGGPPEGHLVREIRRRMIFRSADVPRLVDRLERDGLVVREDDPADRRGTRVRLTPAGEALEGRIRPLHAALCEGLGRHLEPGPREDLLGSLERLRDALRAEMD
jgi:DNA-binding MarR family transcriptional regulator